MTYVTVCTCSHRGHWRPTLSGKCSPMPGLPWDSAQLIMSSNVDTSDTVMTPLITTSHDQSHLSGWHTVARVSVCQMQSAMDTSIIKLSTRWQLQPRPNKLYQFPLLFPSPWLGWEIHWYRAQEIWSDIKVKRATISNGPEQFKLICFLFGSCSPV